MIYLIGMGPGNIKYLTFDAVEKIKLSSKVLAFGRIGRSIEQMRDDVVTIDKVDDILTHLSVEGSMAVLASGDPCFYGILEYLGKKGISVDEVVPGISSFQYMMTRLKKSWHNACLVSLHGREQGLENVKNSKLSVVITDSKNTPGIISESLRQLGVKGKIYAGFNLSYDDEYIVEKNIGEDIPDYSFLSVVVIENEMD